MALTTVWERMLAGERYTCHDPGLEADRKRTKQLLRRYNSAEDMPQRQAILQQLLGQAGRESVIEPPFYCSYGRNIYLGDHVYLNVLCTILDCNEVRLGNHVMVGPAVQIYTAAHDLLAEARNQGWETARPVVVGDNVWLGGGAVVTRDLPANTVVAGNPARVIREIQQE